MKNAESNNNNNNNNNRSNNKILILSECAVMIALSAVLELLCKLLPGPWVNGGGISVGVIPLLFIAYRHGSTVGLVTCFADSLLQMMMGWYAPPAGTLSAFILCVLLDYVIAYTVIGLAPVFSKPFRQPEIGYFIGAFTVIMLRFVCSFLSGAIIWGSTTMWGIDNIWLYSFVYNFSYMFPNAVLNGGLIALLCVKLDPKTLRTKRR